MTSKFDYAWNSTDRKKQKSTETTQNTHAVSKQPVSDGHDESYSDMICVVICTKRHSLRHMGKCEVFISSHSLQATPVSIPIPVESA